MKIWFFGPDNREELREIADHQLGAENFVLPRRLPGIGYARDRYRFKTKRIEHHVGPDLYREIQTATVPLEAARAYWPNLVDEDGMWCRRVAAWDEVIVTERWWWYEYAE